MQRNKQGAAKPVVTPNVTTQIVNNAAAEVISRGNHRRAEPFTWLSNPREGHWLPTLSGLLNVETGTVIPHTPDYFTPLSMSVKYDPDASCPKWDAFLTQVCQGDKELIAIVQETFAQCLLPHHEAKRLTMFVGDGDNGKSVILFVLRSLLGEHNTSAVPLDAIGRDKFATWGQFGKLGNIVGDQSRFDSHDEGELKKLTRGDAIRFEQKGRDPIEGRNTAKIIFACNTVPTFADKTSATWNRCVLIPMTYVVPRDKRNPAMLTREYWAAELPGVLNWALASVPNIIIDKFTRSAKCEELKAEHRRISDPVGAALFELYEAAPDECEVTSIGVTSTDVMRDCEAWLADNRYTKTQPTSERIASTVKRLFPTATKTKKRFTPGAPPTNGWAGLRKRSHDA